MDKPIRELDNRTDLATRQMLQGVVKRKQKFDRFKTRHLIVMWLAVGVTAVFLHRLYTTIIKPYSYSVYDMFSNFVGQETNLYFLVAVGGLFGLMNLLKEKREKAEKEFHALRCETIDKSKDLWKKEDEWKNRHLVYETMKKHYDINLYHENK